MRASRRAASIVAAHRALGGLAAMFLLAAPGFAADVVSAGNGGAEPPVTIENIPGNPIPRVTLSAKAAQRLGIEVGRVEEIPIARTQVVGGLVVAPAAPGSDPAHALGSFEGFARVAPARSPPRARNGLWVSVMLSAAEWERVAKDKPARLMPLPTRPGWPAEVFAQPSGVAPAEDPKRSMLAVHYVIAGGDHGLTLNERVRVVLALAGTGEVRKVVPYAAIYYDGTSQPCVYERTGPLTFTRRSVVVERIDGDAAVLTEGPPAGTPVVVVGAPLLYGAEVLRR